MDTYKSICLKITALLLCSLLLFCYTVPLFVNGAGGSMTDIRVGLKSLYVNVNSIKINTASIGLGYCIDDRYVCDTQLYSEGGFTFTPATGYFYILEKTYQTYQAAKNVADTLSGLKVNAYPVCIYRNYWRVYIGGSTDKGEMNKAYEYIKGRFNFTYSALQTDNKQRVLVSGKGIAFLLDGEKRNAYPQIRALKSNNKGDYVLDLGSRQYRGRIEIGRFGKNSLTAVNIVNIESYLYGVVPSEMVSSWPEEALKAQAVCARSFALIKTGYSADSDLNSAYSIDDTISSQVYKGYSAEALRTTKAVDATKGEVITYQGKMIPAYFFSTSGGSTENGSDVWGTEYPYLKGVADSYETEPEKEPWLISYTAAELASKLTKNGVGIGGIRNVVTQLITSSGRVYNLKLFGENCNISLKTGRIRDIFDLPSTKFRVVKYADVPDKVSIRSSSGVKEEKISDCYILGAAGVKKADTSLGQFIVKGAGNLMNYPVNAPKTKDTYLFAGMGYGHGVGMSQSGAKGMANAGFIYKEIIQYYYTDCQISNANQ